MKKHLLFFILAPSLCASQIEAGDRLKLMQLLRERKEKFGSYTTSINTKSGIFGNTTKKDLRRSNDILLQLVKTDNGIFEGLNNMLKAKNYEKTSMSYDFRSQDEQLQYYNHLTDTLAKQLEHYRATDSRKTLVVKRYRIYNYSLLLLTLLLLISNLFYWKRMRNFQRQ